MKRTLSPRAKHRTGVVPVVFVAALVAAVALASLSFGTAACAQDSSAAHGKLLFESRCVACHSLDTNRVGPALGTVWGRKAGTEPGFAYSEELVAAGHVWTKSKLLAWLTNPEALVPGQLMGYSVESAPDRQDLVAFLASLDAKTASKQR